MSVTWSSESTGKPLDIFEVGSKLQELGIDTEPKVTKDGKLLFTSDDQDTIEKLISTTELQDGSTVIAEHFPSQGSKCIIKCKEVAGRSEEDLKRRLETEGVTGVKALGKNGTFILSIKSNTPPPMIRIGPFKIQTEKYIPRPLLCRRCFVYGHAEKACRNKPACRSCGNYHLKTPSGCPPMKCRNCGGKHLPTDRNCAVWKQELAICEAIASRKLPGKEARDNFINDHKDYIVPPKIDQKARKDPALPPTENKITKVKTTKNPDKRKAPTKRKAAPTKTATTSGTSTPPPSRSIDLTDDGDDDQTMTPSLSDFIKQSNHDYQLALKAIYGSSDDSEETLETTTTPVKKQKKQKKVTGKKSKPTRK